MKQKKIALLIDIDNVKIGGEAFNELYDKLSDIGDVVYGKLYGFNDRKHVYLSDAVVKFGFETASFMRFKKRFSQLDIRIVVDAIKLNYTKPEIDTFCIVAGEGDLIPLLVELKSSGKTIIDINSLYQEMNYHMFDAHISLSNMNKTVEVYSAKSTRLSINNGTTKSGSNKTSSRVAKDDYNSSSRVAKDDYNSSSRVAKDDYNSSSRGAKDDYNSSSRGAKDDYNSSSRVAKDDYNSSSKNSYKNSDNLSTKSNAVIDNSSVSKESLRNEEIGQSNNYKSYNSTTKSNAVIDNSSVSKESLRNEEIGQSNNYKSYNSTTKSNAVIENSSVSKDSLRNEEISQSNNYKNVVKNGEQDKNLSEPQVSTYKSINRVTTTTNSNTETKTKSEPQIQKQTIVSENNQTINNKESNTYKQDEKEVVPEEYYEETVYDNDQLSIILKDITDRYSELDFSSNQDIDKKVELINDIESLVKDETGKGEGLNSKNADIRQIFVELQNIVDDMKSVL